MDRIFTGGPDGTCTRIPWVAIQGGYFFLTGPCEIRMKNKTPEKGDYFATQGR